MIDLLLILIGVSNLLSQWYWNSRLLKAAANHSGTKAKVEPMVTPTNPAFTNENQIGQGDSIIVEPKSPQLVAWEEQEELRKLNLKPR